MRRLLLLFVLTAVAPAAAAAQDAAHAGHGEMKHAAGEVGFFSPSEVAWKDGPGSLPAGARFAILEGDPAKEGAFTMRLWFPDGYRIPPHSHSKVEHITVISGSFNLGMGDKFDRSATREMAAGTFGFWPGGMRHFAWAKGETVVQLHGIGPWTITYVNPADDPRKASK
ncbi:MAG TPA: cupin domain-containing protein [Pyrinomonadaceae bacterium]|nr:cupin domain-containing protein [Pyrinomonadaceae bacterium]